MQKNRLLKLTLAASLLAHGVIVLRNPLANLLINSPLERKIEVNYLSKKLEVKKLPSLPAGKKLRKQEQRLRFEGKTILAKTLPPPFIDREKLPDGLKAQSPCLAGFAKPVFSNPEALAIKKKITLPPMNLEKIDNPAYISYYQVIREKIRRAAYQNYSYTQTGEVYLSFMISREGLLKAMRIVEERSVNNAYLQEIAVRSLKDAAPFPDFPKDLRDYPQLSFNIVISFEIE